MTEIDRLPEHPVPDSVRFAARNPTLVVEGLVENPSVFRPSDLESLPRVSWDGDFGCEEGWVAVDLHWEGVRLADVLGAVGARNPAGYVRVASGKYEVPLTAESAALAVLCDSLDGKPLTLEQGARWRLLLPGARCFTSVKWVDHIEVATTPGDNTGEAIAQERLAAKP